MATIKIKTWLIKILFLICTSITVSSAQGQILYTTTNGHVVVVAEQDSNRIIGESHKAFIVFNYQKAEIEAILNLKTLDTGIDTLNQLLQTLKESEVRYKGKLGIDYIETKSHPPQTFDILGMLTLNSVTKQVTFKATLTHLSNSSAFACLLTAGTTIKFVDFNIRQSVIDSSETINIQIVQSVLRKDMR
jgi:hypothetical protein